MDVRSARLAAGLAWFRPKYAGLLRFTPTYQSLISGFAASIHRLQRSQVLWTTTRHGRLSTQWSRSSEARRRPFRHGLRVQVTQAVVTNNVRNLSRVPGLSVENWA
jgi:hypothetical protein